VLKCIGKIARKEWRQANKYQLTIRKHGSFVKMINSKEMQGPVANASFPTRPG